MIYGTKTGRISSGQVGSSSSIVEGVLPYVSPAERRKAAAEEYMSERQGTYAQRLPRYAAAQNALIRMGFDLDDVLVDLGAGMCDFDTFLRRAGWTGRYVPVDWTIDGKDIRDWHPDAKPDFITMIEVIEHLHFGDAHMMMLRRLKHYAKKGIVLTTPNVDELGQERVLAMDRTHQSYFSEKALQGFGFQTEVRSFFGGDGDSILAWWGAE